MLVILLRLLVLKSQQQVIRFVITVNQSLWSGWNFLIRLLRLRLSQNQKLTKKKCHWSAAFGCGRPVFAYRSDEEIGQTIIKGMGELHLDIIIDV